jgi:hypothetical protein
MLWIPYFYVTAGTNNQHFLIKFGFLPHRRTYHDST